MAIYNREKLTQPAATGTSITDTNADRILHMKTNKCSKMQATVPAIAVPVYTDRTPCPSLGLGDPRERPEISG
jgi:hypothetical protein